MLSDVAYKALDRKSLQDFQLENELFKLKKAATMEAKSGNLPAALQIADRMTQLRASKDPDAPQQIQDIMMAQKMMRVDPGVYMQGGEAQEIPGYTGVMSGIKGGVAGAEQQAKKSVDLMMNPQIARGETDQRNLSDLEYSGPIRQQEKQAEYRAEEYGSGLKKSKQANETLDILTQAEALLPKASGSLGGTAMSAVKSAAGISDETTQANEQLKLLSGWLVANVPRMEGPQSNFDVQNYQRMAADLGNSMKPIGDRLAALQGLRALQEKYSGQIPAIDQGDLGAYIPQTPNPGPPPPPKSLYERSEEKFNAKKKKPVSYQEYFK